MIFAVVHFLVLFVLLVVIAFAAPNLQKLAEAPACDPNACQLPNCLCASTSPPANLAPSQVPQFVVFTFDDAVSVQNIRYYRDAFYNRQNPNGCPVGTTYYTTHEYADYSLVHELWQRAHEIALHSITHQVPASYWQLLDVEGYKREFVDQIDLISHFANISRSSIKGMRIPFLQLAGDNSYLMIQGSDLQYDSSWPTRTYMSPPLFPYTLDYKSPQDCPILPCPTSSIPGVWVMPMVDWYDDLKMPCAMVDSCANIPQDEDGLLDFMKSNFHRHYSDDTANHAPFGFYIHAAWFGTNENIFKAYLRFLDYLGQLNDVYIVTQQTVLEWMKNPTPLKEYEKAVSCPPQQPADGCLAPKSCRLIFGSSERYMTVCSESCPAVYPWLNNPLGNAP